MWQTEKSYSVNGQTWNPASQAQAQILFVESEI